MDTQPFDSIESGVITGLVEGFIRRVRRKNMLVDNIVSWTGLLEARCTVMRHHIYVQYLLTCNMQPETRYKRSGAFQANCKDALDNLTRKDTPIVATFTQLPGIFTFFMRLRRCSSVFCGR